MYIYIHTSIALYIYIHNRSHGCAQLKGFADPVIWSTSIEQME